MTSFEVPCHHCAKSRLEHNDVTDHEFKYMNVYLGGPIIDVTPEGVEVIQERNDSNDLTLEKLRKAIRLVRVNRDVKEGDLINESDIY